MRVAGTRRRTLCAQPLGSRSPPRGALPSYVLLVGGLARYGTPGGAPASPPCEYLCRQPSCQLPQALFASCVLVSVAAVVVPTHERAIIEGVFETAKREPRARRAARPLLCARGRQETNASPRGALLARW